VEMESHRKYIKLISTFLRDAKNEYEEEKIIFSVNVNVDVK